MASSAFSFHCMICFEEFDPQTNYPVVLPCGHTYVCIECANRLDKCMECRMPLTMKVEPSPPCPPAPSAGAGGTGRDNGGVASAASAGAGGGGGGGSGGAASPSLDAASQKENAPGQNYADRVRNSPGFRRRYGQREEYRAEYARSGGGHDPYHKPRAPPPPPQPIPKQRLPLPKNAVLLSLIQASEPARRRAEVEAPPTPQKPSSSGGTGEGGGPTLGSETPSPGARAASLPKYSRPSPLFLDGSSSGEHDGGGGGQARLGNVGSSAEYDEEQKIRVGTYLEGGPCGTYAVAARGGLLVYPTLFEHTLPSALSSLGKNGRGGEEEDAVKRDVEELVKRHRAQSLLASPPELKKDKKKKKREKKKKKKKGVDFDEGMSHDDDDDDDRLTSSPVDTEIGSSVSHTWVECHEDENVEAHCSPLLPPRDHRKHPPLDPDVSDSTAVSDSLSDPGGVAHIDTSGEGEEVEDGGPLDLPEEDDVHLSVSLTISDGDSVEGEGAHEMGEAEDPIGASSRTLPARRSHSHAAEVVSGGGGTSKDDATAGLEATRKGKFVRHFSQGYVPAPSFGKGAKGKAGKGGDGDGGGLAPVVDEFDRPLIRLKYGDRVQVVSMDSRGWVKLARGYGYIRLENDKQLVKVGGTSDKACQIEAMLHELSIERNRLKNEQTKLERLSAGLMIDLQSTLLTSDDKVVVPAPEGSLIRTDSELSLLNKSRAAANISLDDIDVSTRSRTVLTPPRGSEGGQGSQNHHREIRTAKSHSPGRSSGLGGATRAPKAPPSPPYGQVSSNIPQNNWSTVNTPTRVNFRTGLSGHRALTSSHSHPHDFIDSRSGVRSMSNHSGISSSKKPSSRGRSIY